MIDSIINCANPAEADVLLLGAPYDLTSSFGKGASGGPEAIVDCLHRQIEFYERVSGTIPAERLRIAYHEPRGLSVLSPKEMVAALGEVYAKHPGKFVILLGGEHSVSNAPFEFYAGQAGQITIVQIDAHADLREDDSDYNENPFGRYAHCSVMRRGYELGYHLVQVGVRAYSSAERELFGKPRIKVFEWGLEEPAVSEIVSAIPSDQVYLTIDIDGFDPSCLPATGTPVPGGLSWYYGLALIKELCRCKKVIGADIVEVAPRAQDALTEYGAAQLCYTLIGCALSNPEAL